MTDQQSNFMTVVVLIGVLVVIAAGVWYAIYRDSPDTSVLPPRADQAPAATPAQ
jgi:hypothetical protein